LLAPTNRVQLSAPSVDGVCTQRLSGKMDFW
jgi:hypothetical protein